eukprot:c9944_g1_i1.p1 GENE.c9944_g1_i1~~c9944_g1_i1.p1  ORF type:complete len:529 (-),score=161.32 c9944_g1_i1:34-1620(-)
MRVKVMFAGDEFPVTIPEESTLQHLSDLIFEHVGILREHQKLLWKGQNLLNAENDLNQKLDEIGISEGARLMLLGAPAASIAQLATVGTITDPTVMPFEGRSRPPRYTAKPPTSAAKSYFHNFKVLTQFPDHSRASVILSQLATDVGIVKAMEKHKFRVMCLSEMYPEGLVGVDDVCVLGLNVNHGEEIKLRLRTDDLKGFRSIADVRKVLFHELAHNVHSDHNDQFFQLMRQIEKDANSLDWTKSQGHTLTGSTSIERFSGPSQTEQWQQNVQIREVNRLGTGGSRNKLLELLEQDSNRTPQQQQQQQPQQSQEQQQNQQQKQQEHFDTDTHERQLKLQRQSHEADLPIPLHESVSTSSNELTPPPPSSLPQALTENQILSSDLRDHVLVVDGNGNPENSVASPVSVPDLMEFELDDSLMKLVQVQQERVEKIRQHVSRLAQTLANPSATISCLLRIISNALQNPQNPKFCRLNTQGSTFQNLINNHEDALAILRLSGWVKEGDAISWNLRDDVAVMMCRDVLSEFL